MTSIFTITLIAHILLGIAGVVSSYVVWLGLLKSKQSLSFLRTTSIVATVLYFASWLSGGYYYALYYGAHVKPVILAGAYPWAHKFFIEVKEHVFMFLPFMALATVLALYVVNEQGELNERSRKWLTLLVGITTIIGIFITLSGVVVSGAVR